MTIVIPMIVFYILGALLGLGILAFAAFGVAITWIFKDFKFFR